MKVMQVECLICIQMCNERLSCGHYYHTECLTKWFKISNKYKCLYCMKIISLSDLNKYIDIETLYISGTESSLELISFIYDTRPDIFTMTIYSRFIRANNLPVLHLLESKSYTYDKTAAFIIACSSTLDTIIYFDKINNNNVDEATITTILENAVINSNNMIIAYIIKHYHYCRNNVIFSQYAILYNDLELLKCLIRADFKLSECLMSKAIINDNVEIVKILYLIGYNKFSKADYFEVIKYGHIDVLEYLIDIAPDIFNQNISVYDINDCIKFCNPPMLYYLCTKDITFDNMTMANACLNPEHNFIIEQLYTAGCEFTTDAFENICLLNLQYVVKFIIDLKLDNLISELFICASKNKNYAIIDLVINSGFRLIDKMSIY